MKISNRVKIVWWLIIVIFSSIFLIVRRDILLSGNATTFDSVIILVWIATLFAPLFSEMNIFGLQLRNEIKEIKRDVQRAEESVKDAEKSVVNAENSIKAVSGKFPSWTLLFEHDNRGNQINGTIDQLIEAVEEGYQIKVKIFQSNGSIQVMDAQWLFIEDKVVYASNINHISLTRNKSGKYVYQENSYHYYVIVGSNGHHHATRINLDGSKREPTDSTRQMAWIGLVPPDLPSIN